jgi:SH3-like domain-containing protein
MIRCLVYLMRILILFGLLAIVVSVIVTGAPDVTLVTTVKAAPNSAKPSRTGLKLPRFVSLRADEVNVRAGPGVRYPVKWVFVQRNLPVEITAEYETWRKVRDSTGAEGWVHRAMLFGRRNVLVIDKQATMRRQPQDDSPAIARLNPGMVVRLEKCGAIWCNVSVQGYEGWLRRAEVWGLYLDEQPK